MLHSAVLGSMVLGPVLCRCRPRGFRPLPSQVQAPCVGPTRTFFYWCLVLVLQVPPSYGCLHASPPPAPGALGQQTLDPRQPLKWCSSVPSRPGNQRSQRSMRSARCGGPPPTGWRRGAGSPVCKPACCLPLGNIVLTLFPSAIPVTTLM